MSIGKLVVAFMNLTNWSTLVGRVRQLERQKCTEESSLERGYEERRRSQGVWYLWHKSIRLQWLVSFTKPVYGFCEGNLPVSGIAFSDIYGIVFCGWY